MERKRIIAVGVEGPTDRLILGEDVQWVEEKPGRGAILFGLPRRSEDDAERALRTAGQHLNDNFRLSVQEAAVVVGSSKEPDVAWKEVFPEETKLLQDGEAIVSPNLARLYERLFLFERTEEDGKEYFFLRGARNRPNRLRGLRPTYSPMVGRDREMARLRDLLEQIRVDQGQIAGIVGEAGIGKTRAVVAFQQHLKEANVPWVEGRFTVGDRHRPWSAFESLAQALAKGVGAKSLSALEEVDRTFLQLLLQPGTRIEAFADLTDEQIRTALHLAFRSWIHSLADSPLVLFLEDLHWADSSSMELLEVLMDGMESKRLLIVLAHRPYLTLPWKQRLNYNELRLSPLSPDALEKMIGGVTGADRIAARVKNDLVDLTVGNPLFAEEILRKLLDQGSLQVELEDDGKRVLRTTGIELQEIPETIHSLVASRFDRLIPNERDVLRWAALLGNKFDCDELYEVVREEMDIEPPSDDLVERGFLVEETVFPHKMIRFTHDLVFDVVMESLPDAERAKREARLAKFLIERLEQNPEMGAERVAEHALVSDQPLLAIEWATRAGEWSLSRFNYPMAEYFFRRAAEAWKSLPSSDRPPPHHLFESWIHTLLVCGNQEEASVALTEWKKHGAIRDASARGIYFLSWAQLHAASAEWEFCLAAADRAIEALKGIPQRSKEHGWALERRLQALAWLGKGRELVHESFTYLKELGERSPSVRLGIWARLCHQATLENELEPAADFLKQADALDINRIGPSDILNFYTLVAPLYEKKKDLDGLVALWSRAYRLASTSGMRDRSVEALLHRAAAYSKLSNFDAARRDIDLSLQELRALKHRVLEMRAWLSLALVHVEMKQMDEAKRIMAQIEREHGRLTLIWNKDLYEAIQKRLKS